MTHPQLRSVSVREFISALERDGFFFERGKGGHLLYRHGDGRQVTVSFHRSGAMLKRGTLLSMLRATRWTDADLRRLGLVSAPPEAHP